MLKTKRVFLVLLMIGLNYSSAATGLDELNENHCQHLIVKGEIPNTIIKNSMLYYKNDEGEFFLQKKKNEGIWNYEFIGPNGKIELKDKTEKIRDFVVAGERIWVVNKNGLLEYNLNDGMLLGHYHMPIEEKILRQIKPRGIYHHKETNLLFLAAGRLGLVTFHIDYRKFIDADPLDTRNGEGPVSSSVAISGDGSDYLFISQTGNHSKGFNGIVVYNLKEKKIVNASEYDKRRVGVIYPYSQIYTEREFVYLNNGGWIHRLSKKTLMKKKVIRPKWIPISIGEGRNKQYIMFEGDFIFSQSELLACGLYNNANDNSKTWLSSKAFSVPLN
jgi:hypothetical protein